MTTDTLDSRQVDLHHQLRLLPRLRRYRRWSGRSRPAAGRSELPGRRDLQRLDAPGLLLAHQRVDPDARDAAVEALVRRGRALGGRRVRAPRPDLRSEGRRARRPGDPEAGRGAQDAADRRRHEGPRRLPPALLDVPRRRGPGRRPGPHDPRAGAGQLHRGRVRQDARRGALLEGHGRHRQHRDAAVGHAARRGGPLERDLLRQAHLHRPERARGRERRAAGPVPGANRRTRIRRSEGGESPYENTADAKASGKQLYERSARDATAPRRSATGRTERRSCPHRRTSRRTRLSPRPPSGGTGASIRASWASTAATRRTCIPTAMPAWRFILNDQQKWDIIYYTRDLVGAKDAEAGQ